MATCSIKKHKVQTIIQIVLYKSKLFLWLLLLDKYDNTCKVKQRTNKYTLGKLEERKPQKIGDSRNSDRAGAWKYSIKKVF